MDCYLAFHCHLLVICVVTLVKFYSNIMDAPRDFYKTYCVSVHCLVILLEVLTGKALR